MSDGAGTRRLSRQISAASLSATPQPENSSRRRSWWRTLAALLGGTTAAASVLVLGAPPASAAITATILVDARVMSVFADNLDNTVIIGRTASGTILVNGGAVPVVGGTPTVANVERIQVFGLGGNDVLSLDESNGALPAALLFGGAGNDTVTGGSGRDQLFGQDGNDALLGRGGIDLLFGGLGDDVLTGGDADDQVFGEAGADRMIWNFGDDTDLNEGGADADTVEVNGGNGSENFTATANGARVRFDRVGPAAFSIDIGTTENLRVQTGGGNDRFEAGSGLAALIRLSVDGGLGVDQLVFNGSGENERLEVSSTGGGVRLTRDVAGVVVDLNDVEALTLNSLGGVDRLTVRDLSGTDLTEVVTDLASVSGSTVSDLAGDTVQVEGTAGDDAIQVSGSPAEQVVSGLTAKVTVRHADAWPIDRVVIAAMGGDDVVLGSSLAAPAGLQAHGGAGNDALIGGGGDDLLLGEDGDDFLLGGPGTDVLNGGAGNNILLQGEVITNGSIPTKAWLAGHTRVTRGGTVIDLGTKSVVVLDVISGTR